MALDDAVRIEAPGVTPATAPLGFWAAYRTARRNVLELIPEAAYREPVLTGGRNPGWIMVMDPPALERVFKRAEAYPKSRILKRLMRPRRGENLVIAEGAAWRWRRRAMAGPFAPAAVAACAPAVASAAETACRRLRESGGRAVDVHPVMVDASCDVICDVALSGREAVDRERLTASVNAFVRRSARISLLDLLGAPGWLPRPGELMGGGRAGMDRMLDAIVAARLARGPSGPPDLLDLMIAARDPETGRGLDTVGLRNDLAAFLFAGHETTALALSWSLWILAAAPAVQDRAAEEARAALGAEAATAEAYERLPYVRRVVEEALRLFPPAGFLTRTAAEDDELAGRPVRKGQSVILPIYALHRHKALWARPTAIDPDRFALERAAGRHRFAYLPFGAGPRVCIGASLAMIEATLILATLVARLRVTAPEGRPPKPAMWFTLRPEGGIPLEVSPR
ncbi:MAG: cytochrome P450 [Paracoccaceae bacterium]